jgi:hypothetical protein
MVSKRVILCIALSKGLKVKQKDVLKKEWELKFPVVRTQLLCPRDFKLRDCWRSSDWRIVSRLILQEERGEMAFVPYRSAVGALMYLMVCTRPDIAQAAGEVSRFLENPEKDPWNAVKRILRYVQGTMNCGLVLTGEESFKLVDMQMLTMVDV